MFDCALRRDLAVNDRLDAAAALADAPMPTFSKLDGLKLGQSVHGASARNAVQLPRGRNIKLPSFGVDRTLRTKLTNCKVILKAAQINTWIDFGIFIRFFALDDVESDGMFDVVDEFHGNSAEPEAHEIPAGSEKEFAKQESGTPLLAGAEADKLPFLRGIRIDHAIPIHVVEGERQIAVGKTVYAMQFYLDAKIAARVGKFELLSRCT